VTATTSPGITAGSPRVQFPTELLPSEIHEEKPQAVRKYLRRETDIPALDFRQNPTQGRIAGRIVRNAKNCLPRCSGWTHLYIKVSNCFLPLQHLCIITTLYLIITKSP